MLSSTKFLSILFVCLSFFHSIFAETVKTGTISGHIYTSSKQPAIAVVVGIEGTSYHSTSNAKGEFKIQLPAGNYTLATSSIEYEDQRQSISLKAGQEVKLSIVVSPKMHQLKEFEVVSKSNNQLVREQAFNVAAVDAAKLYNSSANLNQSLNKSTGIRIREEGGVGSAYSFSLNGFSGKQIKFFFDGVPLDNFGSSWGLSSIPANSIERIEIYKGVLPIQLGGDALGGAVNIVSRNDMNYLDASYTIGSFNTHKLAISGAYTHAKTGFTVRANTFFNYSDNSYKVYVPILDLQTNQKGPEQWVNRFHDHYRGEGIKIETGLSGKSYADYLLFGFILSEDKKDIQTGVTMESVYGAKTSNSQSFIPSVRYKKSNLFVEGLTLTAYAAFNQTDYTYIDTTPRRYNWLGNWVSSLNGGETSRSLLHLKNQEELANANLNYELNEHHSLGFNYTFSHLDRKSNDDMDPGNLMHKIPQSLSKNIAALGWTVKYDRWNLNVFGKMYQMQGNSSKYVDMYTTTQRLEKITANFLNFGYGTAFTYFILQNLQAKISYEHTYRLPSGDEMFGDGLFNIQNPDLKPENSDNFNLGASYTYKLDEHVFNIESNFLYRNSKDYIQKELKDPTTQYVNLGAVKTIGVEGTLKYSWKQRFHAEIDATWQKATDNMPTITTTGLVGAGTKKNLTYKDQLPNTPYLFGNMQIGYDFKDLFFKKTKCSLNYDLVYVHDYYLSWPSLGSKSSKSIIPQQLTHNVSIAYSLQDERYNIAFECVNLTNEKVYDSYMLQKPGRAFYLTLRYAFKYQSKKNN